MKTGLYAFTMSQNGSASVLRVGWFRQTQEDPDEYDVWMATPYRGEYQTLLSDVWKNGPKFGGAAKWKWGPQLEASINRFHFQTLARMTKDADKWAEICPKPPEIKD